MIESKSEKQENKSNTLLIRENKDVPFISDVLSNIPKNSNEFLRKKEQIEYAEEKRNKESTFLYPTLDDPNFSHKIASHQEFADTKYDGELRNIKEFANKMCESSFELLPHQLFVKNFLSFQTPYNSLLLYHGLGSGKTCSSIGIAEEMRSYMKQVGIKQRIIVVAAPNVQANYRLQLFDERKLREVDGIWTIDSCVGNAFIEEINPTNIKGIPRERIISQVKSIINQYYVFMGYVELANFIRKKISITNVNLSFDEKRKLETQNMRRFFNNRLIIIDEVHNIRLSEDNQDDKTGKLLMDLSKHCNNMRLLLLSATPMYNSHNEIIWLTNLMNANDKRGLIKSTEVFNSDGTFKKGKKDDNGNIIEEGGEELLHRKLTGYISYVRGENPYTFPYRIYPEVFAPQRTFYNSKDIGGNLIKVGQTLTGNDVQQIKLPTVQLNGKDIKDPLTHFPLYITNIGSYQEKAYNLIIETMKTEIDKTMNFDELDRFGFRRLQLPLEALNIVYPSPNLDNQIQKGKLQQDEKEDENEKDNLQDPRATMVGKRGMKSVMNYIDESNQNIPRKYNFSYKPEMEQKYGRIFHSSEISKYSAKIGHICDIIKKSKGIVLIYSQYIDGGVVPLALALEEMGFARYSSSENSKTLFERAPTEPLDALTMQPKSKIGSKPFSHAKYTMITGDKAYSPQNALDIKTITNSDNKNGEKVKVVLISKAGSEGLDFKCIRQIHILEPWYNTNRLEQILGRGIRNLSHCLLPFEERNVEIYMHGTVLENNEEEEAVDIYIYRLAKNKAKTIGRVTRLLKETSVDCLLNIGQNNFTEQKLLSIAANQNIQLQLSTDNKKINYKIGDRPYSEICDYMESCEYKCKGKDDPIQEPNKDMYSMNFLQGNNGRIMKRIREIYRDKDGQHFYDLSQIINMVNVIKQYPVEQIYSALSSFIKNKNEYVIDKYGRRGNLINKGNIYAFQPVEMNDEGITIFERKVPIDFKRPNIIMEIPKEFDEENQNTVSAQQMNYETILREIKFNLDNATTTQNIPYGEQDWYKHASRVMNHLQLVHRISYKDYVNYIIHHNIDTLMPEKKLMLISHFYSKVRENNKMSEVEVEIKSYLDDNLISHKNKSGFLLVDTKNWKLYIQSSENSQQWEEAEPEDVRNFEVSGALTSKMKVESDDYSKIIGFIDMFRNGKEMVFRIKDTTQMQNNTGTRINSQTPGKGDIIKRLNQIVHDGETVTEPMYNLTKSKEIMQQGLCVIVELLLRDKTNKKVQNQVWYLTPGKALYNNIAKFRKT